MPRWVLEVLWKRGFKMYEGYGTTENSPVYGFNDRLERLGSVGKPIDTLVTKIVDDDNRTLPPRQRGEICLGGPCIMKGYYKNPKATQAALDTDEQGVRWLHTGDLGYLDEEGNLYITGRKKYLIILPGGKNVNPERVEAALSEARFVKEVLVVPTRRLDNNGIMEESVRALVLPAWELLESHTGRNSGSCSPTRNSSRTSSGRASGTASRRTSSSPASRRSPPTTWRSTPANSSRPPPARSNASTTSTSNTWRPSTPPWPSTPPRDLAKTGT